MVDGEASVMMMAMFSSQSPSRQGARTKFLVLNRGFWWWHRSGTLSGKNAKPPIFPGQKVYVGRRRGQGDGRGGLTTPWHGLAWPTSPGGVSPLWPPSVSYSGSVCLLVK
jgi:hypothetical protein